MKFRLTKFWLLAAMLAMVFSGVVAEDLQGKAAGESQTAKAVQTQKIALDDIPAFSGKPYVVINKNEPFFTKEEIVTKSYEYYSPLDRLGRCQAAMACLGKELMPTEERGNIGMVKPSGWQTSKYDFVDGKYLYNRCHLIAFCLTGENANTKNLITGTRYMNTQGMLPFENKVCDFVKKKGKHVMYRVTPMFAGDNLLASGVLMEACSVEDSGRGIKFNVFCYNLQPGVLINYATGENWDQRAYEAQMQLQQDTSPYYVGNLNSGKYHRPECSGVATMNPKNKIYLQNKAQAQQNGFTPCGLCKP